MGEIVYFRVSVTEDFVKMLKIYTRRLKEIESKKNGTRKHQITKKIVCDKIISDMRNVRLI